MQNQSNEYDPGDLLDKEQVAAYLRVSVAWLNSPHRRKVLPDGMRMGKKKYWFKADLDTFISKQRKELLAQFEAQPVPAAAAPKPAAIVRSGSTEPPKKRGRKPKLQIAAAPPDPLERAETDLQTAIDLVRKLLHERDPKR